MATQHLEQGYPEPNQRWKAQLKSRIDENLQKLLDDAKASYEQKVNETRPEDSSTRRKLYLEYLQTTDNLKSFAADEYAYAVEREKQDLQWCLRAQESSDSQVDTELEAELEALKEEQFAILNAIHMETTATTAATTSATLAPQPETHTQTHQQQHHDSDPFGFYNFASLSPLFTPTQLPGIQSESESEEGSSEEGSDVDDDGDDDDESSDESETNADSRTPSPSPPSTPPLSSTSTSASSSQYCVTPHAPVAHLSVQDEEARLRAERNAKQQEEFHRRAEEIRRRNKEKQRLKEEGESAVRRLEAPSLYYSDEDSTRYTNTTTAIFTSASASASASASTYTSSSASASTSTSTSASTPASSASTSASSSAASSSCNSPLLPTYSTVPVSSLDPFIIAPLCEEDMIRLFIFHDQQWTRISSYHSLQWSDFPWPVLNFIGPRSERELTLGAVSEYILAASSRETDNSDSKPDSSYSQSKSKLLRDYGEEMERKRERVLELIAKWHPERFEKVFVPRVPEARGERERVRYGAGLVVRHLKELLGRFEV